MGTGEGLMGAARAGGLIGFRRKPAESPATPGGDPHSLRLMRLPAGGPPRLTACPRKHSTVR
jgi:hypothetical protein